MCVHACVPVIDWYATKVKTAPTQETDEREEKSGDKGDQLTAIPTARQELEKRQLQLGAGGGS